MRRRGIDELVSVCIVVGTMGLTLSCGGNGGEDDTDSDSDKVTPSGDLLWAVRAGGPGSDDGSAVAVGEDGTIYVAGEFESKGDNGAVFGEGEENETTLMSSGEKDIFLATYEPQGDFKWVKQAGGASNDWCDGAAVLPSGELFIAATLEGAGTFGEGEQNETRISGSDHAYARYKSNGELAWVTPEPGESFGVVMNSNGDYVSAGSMKETDIFGEGEPNETVITSAGDSDVFVAKYNEKGKLVWATRAGGKEKDIAWGVAASPDGSVVATGTWGGDTDGPGGGEGFVAKYDENGKLVWMKKFSGSIGRAVAVAPKGEVYVCGSFRGKAIFGEGEPNETIFKKEDKKSGGGFIAKFEVSGELAWAKSLGSDSYVVGAFSEGSCIVGGDFKGVFELDDPPKNFVPPVAKDSENMFLARFDPEGELVWIKAAHSDSYIWPSKLSVSADDSFVITGRFSEYLIIGPDEPNEIRLESAGDDDIFVAKFAP